MARYRVLWTVGPLVASVLDPTQALVLHSTTHLPRSWRASARAGRSWVSVLRRMDHGQRTRFLFRSRWTTAPWGLIRGGWLGRVPAVALRAEQLAGQRTASPEVAA
jgi:hypothetical protein